jgi:hypothetical protein
LEPLPQAISDFLDDQEEMELRERIADGYTLRQFTTLYCHPVPKASRLPPSSAQAVGRATEAPHLTQLPDPSDHCQERHASWQLIAPRFVPIGRIWHIKANWKTSTVISRAVKGCTIDRLLRDPCSWDSSWSDRPEV